VGQDLKGEVKNRSRHRLPWLISASLGFERKANLSLTTTIGMKKIILSIAITACTLAAQFAAADSPPEVKEIMSKPLTDIPGKEGLVLTVTYPPGGVDEIHYHAQVCSDSFSGRHRRSCDWRFSSRLGANI
jgi:hypothetical protein